MKRRQFIAAIAAILLIRVATSANAGAAVVFDPTNYAENLRAAISAINQEALQTSQLAQLVQQVTTAKAQFDQMKTDADRMRRSMKGMTASQILNLAKNTLPEAGMLANLNDRIGNVRGNLNLLSNQYAGMESFGQYMNWTVTDVFNNERRRNAYGKQADRSFLANIEQAMRATNNDIVQINRIRDQISDTQTDDMQSLRKAMETATVQLNMIAGQNTQAMALMAEDLYSRRSQQVGDRTMTDQAAEAGNRKMLADYARAEQLRQLSADRYRNLWNQPGAR